jgi:hypothetical protein
VATEAKVPDPVNSLTWIFKEPNSTQVYVIGAVLNFVPIVALMPAGYALLIMRDLLLGEPKQLRSWNDLWAETFFLGVKAFGLALVYLLIPAGVYFLFARILQATTAGLFLSLLALVVIYIISPLAVGRMLLHDSFAAGLAFGQILGDLQRAGSAYYITHALALGALLLFWTIGGLPVLGILFLLVAPFALSLYWCTIWGSVCGPLLRKEETGLPEPIQPR